MSPRAAVAALVALGCSAPTTYTLPRRALSAPTPARGASAAPAPGPARGAEPAFLPIDPHCQPGSPETCDGVDEDCDGAIDEGCGYGPGAVQVTASWETGADIDLEVTDPAGDTVSATRRRVPSGGEIDREARGGCPRVDAVAVEDVRWLRDPPTGSYRLRVHVYDDCAVRTSTPVTVSVAARGRTLGTWRATFVRTGQAATLSFRVE